VGLQYQKKKITAGAFVNFNSWKHIDDYLKNAEDNEAYAPAEGMPSWYTVNLRAGFEFSKIFAVLAGVDNLLDLQYRTFSSGINAPGRNLFGTFRVTF
jgi:hemoglobin/transferrin/lactoferrin receptor protein